MANIRKRNVFSCNGLRTHKGLLGSDTKDEDPLCPLHRTCGKSGEACIHRERVSGGKRLFIYQEAAASEISCCHSEGDLLQACVTIVLTFTLSAGMKPHTFQVLIKIVLNSLPLPLHLGENILRRGPQLELTRHPALFLHY